MKTIRVFFTKTGRAKYISHLDVNRCIDRAIKRSGIPVWYTQGFNPHIYTTFAMPISLGFESLCESFETRLVEDDFSLEEVKTALNRVLPTGLEVTQVAEPVMEMKEIDLPGGGDRRSGPGRQGGDQNPHGGHWHPHPIRLCRRPLLHPAN